MNLLFENPRSFRALPLLGNAHVQTLLAHLLPGPPLPFGVRIGSVLLPDGDRLAVHDSIPPRWRLGAGIVVLVHGLGGSHRSGYVLRLAARFLRWGLRVVRVDLRGVGAGAALARRTYHAGCSGDLRAVALHLRGHSPDSPLVLIGMSLGGNVVLKLAGEAAGAPLPGLRAVAAVGPPIDLMRCAVLLARHRFYDGYFARHVLRQLRRHHRHFPEARLPRFPQPLTMRQFDDLWTAPHWGFADALDYYRHASALPVLQDIRVPAFVLTAGDDPFIAVEPFDSLRQNPAVELHIARGGGHLGFLGRDGAGGIRWAEQQVADWVNRQLYQPKKNSL
jgi:predicted alpha/beta-fold hydrolase